MLSVTDLVIERGEDPICGPLTSLQSGEIIHIKGPNGAGKTTLMKTLLFIKVKSIMVMTYRILILGILAISLV